MKRYISYGNFSYHFRYTDSSAQSATQSQPQHSDVHHPIATAHRQQRNGEESSAGPTSERGRCRQRVRTAGAAESQGSRERRKRPRDSGSDGATGPEDRRDQENC